MLNELVWCNRGIASEQSWNSPPYCKPDPKVVNIKIKQFAVIKLEQVPLKEAFIVYSSLFPFMAVCVYA